MTLFLPLISGFLLYLAEPEPSLSPLAFIALIPLLHAAANSQTSKRATETWA
jgi:apolipoprotein N-acyltransferase